jgi:alpha-glucuronidase
MTMTPTAVLYHLYETRPKNVAFIKDKEIWTYDRLATEVDRLARVLYGTYAFLRRIQTGEGLSDLDVSSSPKLGMRILDHWDNLTDSVERGYAG